MSSPVEKVIAALQSLTLENRAYTTVDLHRLVDRALQPDEPTMPGTIVILFDRIVAGIGAPVMSEADALLQYASGNPMDNEAGGHARWYDAGSGCYRTWDWICERDGEKRVFVPDGLMCCRPIGAGCENGCTSS